jgi:hypothetical protein
MHFNNNEEKTDMILIYGECGDTSNTFYINLIC